MNDTVETQVEEVAVGAENATTEKSPEQGIYDTAGAMFKEGKRDEALAHIRENLGEEAAIEAEAVMAAVEKFETEKETVEA